MPEIVLGTGSLSGGMATLAFILGFAPGPSKDHGPSMAVTWPSEAARPIP